MTVGQTIDYDGLTQQALRTVVRTVLTAAAKSGLPGDHHFYITFDTRAPGVAMSRRLRAKYPEEMMIVLQHRFWDLAVTDERFEVKLTFDGIPERLVVPFTAIKQFIDPSVRYTLQFEDATPAEDGADTTNRRWPRDVAELDAEDLRPSRPFERRHLKLTEPTEDTAEPAAPPPPVALTPRPAELPAAPTEATEPAPDAASTSAPIPAAVISPAPSPAGAKVVSIDSWRNRK